MALFSSLFGGDAGTAPSPAQPATPIDVSANLDAEDPVSAEAEIGAIVTSMTDLFADDSGAAS